MVASYADILRLSSRVPPPSSWQRSVCDKAPGTSVWKARGVGEFLMGLLNDPIVTQEKILRQMARLGIIMSLLSRFAPKKYGK